MTLINDLHSSQQQSHGLSKQQRQLVSDNLGLIGVHLGRFVRGLERPRRDREWDDLFQEGCLGLIDAAKRYQQRCDIKFSTFAIPRIRNAVNKALYKNFCTIYIPPNQQPYDPTSRTSLRSNPVTQSHHDDDSLAQACALTTAENSSGTIGDRIRVRYESAIDAATKRMRQQRTTRGDRKKLIETIIKHRLLIPDEEEKTALRQIARETQSSYARVARCEKQFIEGIRHVLEADAEFRILSQHAKRTPLGMNHPVDDVLESHLSQVNHKAITQRQRKADPVGTVSHVWLTTAANHCQTPHEMRELVTQYHPTTRRITSDGNGTELRKKPCPGEKPKNISMFTEIISHR